MMGTSALVPYRGTGMDQARSWAALSDDERRRRAVAACRDHATASLCDLADAWLTIHGKARAKTSPHTRATYRRNIAALLDAWRRENLLRPGRDAGHLWLSEMEDTGSKPATIQVRLAGARCLYAALRWAGATDADPFRDVRPAKDPVPAHEKRDPFTPDELRSMLHVIDSEALGPGPAARMMAHYDRILVLLGAHAGLRASEMMALEWADLDPTRRRLVVREGKGRKRRTIVMSSSLAAALGAIPPEMRGAHVLPYRDRRSAWRRLARLAERAGLPQERRGLHRLRHAAGTRLMAETHDLQEVAELLGHAQLETARIYSKWSDQRQYETVGRW